MNLKPFNTLGLPARAQELIEIKSLEQLKKLSSTLTNKPRVILGEGSNVVVHSPIDAPILINRLKGKTLAADGLVTAAAGENWHELVIWSLNQGFGGLENLALIPGSVGAAPVQNIGAYGVELKDLLIDLSAWDFSTHSEVTFTREDCGFGYRDSIFKNQSIQGSWDCPRYMITSVRFGLKPVGTYEPNISYRDLSEKLKTLDQKPTPMDVAQAVMDIRSQKLPNPKQIGNVGSFFKNPVISSVQAKNLAVLYPDLPHYPIESNQDDTCKIPAAWLIEKCGFKGVRRGDVGVHEKHALVLVNYGDGTGREIVSLAQEIQASVVARFGIFLEPEPVFMPALSG